MPSPTTPSASTPPGSSSLRDRRTHLPPSIERTIASDFPDRDRKYTHFAISPLSPKVLSLRPQPSTSADVPPTPTAGRKPVMLDAFLADLPIAPSPSAAATPTSARDLGWTSRWAERDGPIDPATSPILRALGSFSSRSAAASPSTTSTTFSSLASALPTPPPRSRTRISSRTPSAASSRSSSRSSLHSARSRTPSPARRASATSTLSSLSSALSSPPKSRPAPLSSLQSRDVPDGPQTAIPLTARPPPQRAHTVPVPAPRGTHALGALDTSVGAARLRALRSSSRGRAEEDDDPTPTAARPTPRLGSRSRSRGGESEEEEGARARWGDDRRVVDERERNASRARVRFAARADVRVMESPATAGSTEKIYVPMLGASELRDPPQFFVQRPPITGNQHQPTATIGTLQSSCFSML
ncbi:hypothetical protein EJ06DRAFT_545645 [Trichodelitschia bisporula]|uniref:Uncharacterized protein n=1 Tax=Trichodelitschia bisporula TaxID=703511 RepID=A0A6G1IAE6_9PEZI|nr:hypothetical protein EJ06DRAFT_545645 [Trichodelitschia bisporula]